ncbi:probable DNA primase large subunit [Cajanus cajan]|uniref:probable DNA primase large subunit n=1 Tax=Cajanus cajan TaxID=3821 RepID=UPI00098D79BE|nr:probable DNA primase large subunit [Cajanus cajan]
MEIFRSQNRSNFLSSSNDAVSVPTIPLYRSAPALEVRLEDFESFAIDRLRVLKGISDGLSRGKKPDEMENLVKDLWKVNMRHQHASEVLNKDIISHFVLRLVYCRTEDLRKWFLSMESALFRYRFRLLNAEAQRAVMDEFDLPYRAVSNVEFESIKEKLGQVARSMGQPSPTADAIFYKKILKMSEGIEEKGKRIAIIVVSILILVAMIVAMTFGFNRDESDSNNDIEDTKKDNIVSTVKFVQTLCYPTNYKKECEKIVRVENTKDVKELIKIAFNTTNTKISDELKETNL